MPEKHATEEELVLHHYGELQDSSAGSREQERDARAIEAHIATCATCRAALEELRGVLSLVDTEVLPEPLLGLEARVWSRLAPEVNGRARWWHLRVPGSPRWVLAGGLAAMVVAAFLAGRWTRPDVGPAPPELAAVDPALVAERVMDVAVGDHLDQSQMMLLELLNSDAGPPDSIADDRQRARDLVAANRLYRHTAVQAGNEGVREVLDALERVLIEIANAPPDVSARELDALRAEIEQRGILFRLRVVASEMRAREQNAIGASPAGP